MSVQFGVDASSFQGNVDWARVDASTTFGWEKVTQGSSATVSGGYVNPFWDGPSGNSKRALAVRAAASGFVPGGYLFVEQGDGTGQADFFHSKAGDMAGFAIAIDVEPATGSEPTAADAHACVARLRELYPTHPIIGYLPHFYWGDQSTRFVDVLWAANYVTGSGSPAELYARVVPSQWAAYGGRFPALLQFTDAATVPGISGPVDCSAFRGTVAELRAKLLPGSSQLPPEELMQPGFLLNGAGAVTPLAIPNGAKRLRFFSNRPAEVRVDFIKIKEPSVSLTLGFDKGAQGTAVHGALAVVVHRLDAGDNDVSYVVTGLPVPATRSPGSRAPASPGRCLADAGHRRPLNNGRPVRVSPHPGWRRCRRPTGARTLPRCRRGPGIADSSTIGSSSALPSGADDPLHVVPEARQKAEWTPSSNGLARGC